MVCKASMPNRWLGLSDSYIYMLCTRNCHSSPLHISSYVKLPFLTTRCQQKCEIAILTTTCL